MTAKKQAEKKYAKIYHFDELTPKDIADIAAALKKCALAILPTDTVYGFAVCASRRGALAKLNEAKGNPPAKLPQVLATLKQARACAQDGVLFARAANAFWPGACTLVAKTSACGKSLLKDLPPSSRQTIGLRVPDDKFTLNLMEIMDSPLFATSANLHGSEVCSKEDQILSVFNGIADIIVLKGEISGRPSSVMDVSKDKPEILRAGVLGEEEIKRFLS